MYKSAFGYSRIFLRAKGIRRSSPVNTNMLSFGCMMPHFRGAEDLKSIPPIKKQLSIKNDGVITFFIISCFLIS